MNPGDPCAREEGEGEAVGAPDPLPPFLSCPVPHGLAPLGVLVPLMSAWLPLTPPRRPDSERDAPEPAHGSRGQTCHPVTACCPPRLPALLRRRSRDSRAPSFMPQTGARPPGAWDPFKHVKEC